MKLSGVCGTEGGHTPTTRQPDNPTIRQPTTRESDNPTITQTTKEWGCSNRLTAVHFPYKSQPNQTPFG